jgi:hypothetical protein
MTRSTPCSAWSTASIRPTAAESRLLRLVGVGSAVFDIVTNPTDVTVTVSKA